MNFIIASVLVILFFHVRYGLGMINPLETAWLMKYDWAQHYMGWYFFRNAPWTFPLGNMSNLFYPIGTNIGFTDSIPLVAILLKPFSSLLPEQFQYFGPWLFFNHLLVAFFSIKVLKRLGVEGWSQLFAVILITFNPMLIYRAMHTALASHWLIVANIWVYLLEASPKNRNRILCYQFILFIIGGLINPYFVLINGGFLFILILKLRYYDKVIDLRRGISYVVLSMIALVGMWLITGYFSLSNPSQLGVTGAYGLYSWNLSSFVNPFTFDRFHDFYTTNLSAFLPARELVSWEQYESFSYMGLGVIALTAMAAILCVANHNVRTTVWGLRKNIPLLLLVALTLALSVFAISNKVSWNNQILFNFPLPSFTKLFTDIFRASARFIWLFYYLWFFFLAYVVIKASHKMVYGTGILALIVVIQFADIRPLIFNKKFSYGPYKTRLAHEPLWDKLVASTDAVLFLPPLQTSYVSPDDWQYFSFLAARNMKPISVGHIARIDFAASQAYARKMLDQITSLQMDSTAIYIMRQGYYSQFLTNYFNDKVDVVTMDGYLVVCPFNNKYQSLPGIISEIKEAVDQEFVRARFKSSDPVTFKREVPQENEDLKSGIYEISEGVNTYVFRGWTFTGDGRTRPRDSISVLIRDPGGVTYKIPSTLFGTTDVAEFFHNKYVSAAGFAGVAGTASLPNGLYTVGLELACSGCPVRNRWLDYTFRLNKPVAPVQIAWKKGSQEIKSDINILRVEGEYVVAEGWGFATAKFSSPEIYLTITNAKQSFVFATTTVRRKDVATFFNDPGLANSGFILKFDRSLLADGEYEVGFLVYDNKSKKFYHGPSGRTLLVGPASENESEKGAGGNDAFTPPSETITALPPASDSIKGFIDKISEQKAFYNVEGWGYLSGLDDHDSKTYLALASEKDLIRVLCTKHFRPDLKDAFKHTFNTDSSGFKVRIKKEVIPKGDYKLILLIENRRQYYSLPFKDSVSFK